MKRSILFVLSLVVVAGCQATVGTGAGVSVPKDAANKCGGYCQDLGMSLGAVVVMASNVGCVCTPRTSGADRTANDSGVSGGMAAILMAEEAQRQQQQQPQSHTK